MAATAGARRAPAQPPVQDRLAAVKFRSPVPFRVYQRDRDGKADIAVELGEGGQDVRVTSARLANDHSQPHTTVVPFGPDGRPTRRMITPDAARFEGGKLVGVPAGGPYQVTATIEFGGQMRQVNVGPVYVGDLWVLAGQSNMEGYGDLVDVAPPDPLVMLLGSDDAWSRAEEPLHWLVDSPDPVHSGDPETRAQRSAEQHKNRAKGAGLGLPFGGALARATGIPVGLIASAHGGTSMDQWDPAKKGEGGRSLYGSMVRRIGLAGGKVKGILWYQGESDANPGAAGEYRRKFTEFIAAVRSDLGQPGLPFYFVQIGRFIREADPGPWNSVRDDQLRVAEDVPNTAVVSVIDLELDDLIHVGTRGLKRAGERLARVARRELFGQIGATTPSFDRVLKGAGDTLVVKFKGVNLVAEPPARPPGFVPSFPPQVNPPGAPAVGLQSDRRVAGFSIRKGDGTEIPLIFDASAGGAPDTVTLKLVGPVPEGASLWYGYGLDPYCNLTDAADMAVPAFGPVPLDGVR